MNVFLTLLGRELKALFYTPIAYVVLFYFLLLSGFNFYSLVSLMNGFPTETTLVQAYFGQALFWFPFILSFPLMTMRVFADEYRMGTLETLATAPVTDFQIVVSKFVGVLLFYAVLWLPSLFSFAIFQHISGKEAASATGAYWGTYLLLLLMGMFYISVGNLASALTKDQINAAVIAFTSSTLLLFLGFLPDIMNLTAPSIRDLFSYVSTVQHMQDFSKGIIDSRVIVWYFSMTVLFTMTTLQVFQYRKWKA